MGMFFVSLVLSCIYLLLTIWVALRAGSGWASLLALPFAFLALVVGSEAIMTQCVLTAIAAVCCAGANARRGVMIGVSLSMMVLAYGYTWLQVGLRLQAVEEMRESVPFESIETRLAHEARLVFPEGLHHNERLGPDVFTRLAIYEEEYRNQRQYSLERLHSQIYNDFIIADGFGEMRMMFVSPRSIQLPEIATVAQPEPLDADCRRDGPETHANGRPVDRFFHPSDEMLLTLHDDSHLNFLDPNRFGFVESRERVAGFEPHQFSSLPAVEHADWHITRLELISLLKHEEPMAYVSENLPSMEELADTPVRPLKEFERAAVELLRTDSDLEISYDMNRIDMVGSVRAAESCTECHTVPRGHLLGAFSYVLRRTTPVRLVESIEGD